MNQITTTDPAVAGLQHYLMAPASQRDLALLLPANCPPERYIRIVLNAVIRQPSLLECTPESILKAALRSAELGLEPNGRDCHLIPYKNKSGQKEAQLQIDYKGLIRLGREHGEIKMWRAELVHMNDEFDWFNGQLHHRINWKADRGALVAVYSLLRYNNGEEDSEVMTIPEVESIRRMSKDPNSGAWTNTYGEMAKKVVIKRHSKRVTIQGQKFAEAIDLDNEAYDISSTMVDSIATAPSHSVRPLQQQPLSPSARYAQVIPPPSAQPAEHQPAQPERPVITDAQAGAKAAHEALEYRKKEAAKKRKKYVKRFLDLGIPDEETLLAVFNNLGWYADTFDDYTNEDWDLVANNSENVMEVYETTFKK